MDRARSIRSRPLWLEIDDEGRWLDSLLGRVLGDVESGAYPAIVATIAAQIDPV